jgi:hypothetical protein
MSPLPQRMADHDAFTLLGVAPNASGATREHSGSHELLNYLSVLAAVCSAAIMAAAFFSSAWWLSLLGIVPFLAQLFYVRSFVERFLRWFLFGFFLFGFLNAPLLSFDPIQTGDIRFYAHSALLVRAILIYVGGVSASRVWSDCSLPVQIRWLLEANNESCSPWYSYR